MPYSVTLSNGKKFENLTINGNNFATQEPVTPDMFLNGLSPVIISDGEKETKYERANLLYIGPVDLAPDDDEEVITYLFGITEQTDSQLREEEGISYLASLLLTDEQAVAAPFLFDEWDPNGVSYTAEVSKVTYNDLLYKCLQSHVSQASWNPADAVSLWVRIDDPAIEWPEWRQPTGAHDAYPIGAKVSHNDKHWVSNVDNNTWEPGVFGWDEQVEGATE